MSEKISKYLTKIVMIPFFVFSVYGVAFVIGAKITGCFYNYNDIKSVILIVILTSCISFILTCCVHAILYMLKKEESFMNWFEWSHLILMYIAGLMTFLIAFKPILDQEKIECSWLYSAEYGVTAGIFFIATFNYYFYKAIIINKDIQLLPVIKSSTTYLKNLLGINN